MRQLRRILLALALALPLVAVGCGGSDPTAPGMTDDGGAPDYGTNLPLFSACSENAQCASGLCTKVSYDRATTPLCTYTCDPANPNPLCPMGCNAKGYCKKPM
jgi:hypothetical protein